MLTNYHTHCRLDDGSGRVEEYAERALALGLDALGFSCHAPLPFPQDWVLSAENLSVYLREIGDLKTRYSKKIEIYLGLEVDFVRGIIGPRDPSLAAHRLDYVIGSVHFVDGAEAGNHYAVDATDEMFREAIEEAFGGDARALVREYYRNLREMVSEQTPDIVGHFDVVKKNNTGGRYFDENERWYHDEVMKTLEVIAASGTIVEVNTGGLARKRTDAPYPSPWIIPECHRLGIPMNVNSDAHSPEHLTHWFDEARELLRDAGYREQLVLLGGKWQMAGL